MERTMHELKVYTNKEGQITIEQQFSSHEDPELVVIHPDQVDTLMKWLQEARAELQGQEA